MQAEYEDTPVAEPPVAPTEEGQEGENEVNDVVDRSDQDEPEDEEGDRQDQDQGPAKKKRVIKSRQSLAEKAKGTTLFPLSRIKRIIKADKELDMMSSEATFLVAVATEYFIKHFMEEGYTKARLERRRIVNYKDMANVVSRSEEFDFLRDVVPLPMVLTEALERRKQKLAADEEEAEDAAPAPAEGSSPIKPTLLLNKHEDLPPLAPSTNPLFPNAIVKRPPNTHARGPVTQPTNKPAAAPATPRVHTGKNAPSTPQSLTTRSARRSLNLGQATPTVPPPTEEDMQVDE